MRPVLKKMPDRWADYPAGLPVPHQEVYQVLLDTLGEYCSYCEMRLGQLMISHHKQKKAWPEEIFPEDWDNLLLICNDCRRALTRESLTEEELNDYLWPDRDHSFSLDATSPLKYVTRKVPYTIVDDGREVSTEEIESVFIEVNPSAEPALQRKALNTIELFELNTRHYNDTTHRLIIPLTEHMQQLDNRLIQRSSALHESRAAARRLTAFREHPDSKANPGLVHLLLNQISHTAMAKGNWSVWMTVFHETFNDMELLRNTFINRTDYEPRVQFRGTDPARFGGGAS